MLRSFKSFRTPTKKVSTSVADQPRILVKSIKLTPCMPERIFSEDHAPIRGLEDIVQTGLGLLPISLCLLSLAHVLMGHLYSV